MIKKPQVLINWEEAGPPPVCYNCDFNVSHRCKMFEAVPPIEFQETTGACDKWSCEIPF